MINCKICSDTKRHLVYFNRRNPNEVVSQDKYESFFEKSNAAFKVMSEKITTSKNDLTLLLQLNAIDTKTPEFKTWKQAWRLDEELNEHWVPKLSVCESCVKDEMEPYYQKLKGEPITGTVFSRLAKEGKINGEIVELAKNEEAKSQLIIAPTGRGKTLLLMLNYNRLVKKRKSTDGIKFITESEIRSIMDHDENFETFLKRLNDIEFLFIDEMFTEEVWKDLGISTERDKSNRAARNMWDFWEYLANTRGDSIIVQGAGNEAPDELLPGLKDKSAEKWWRRFTETFKEIRRIA